MFYPLLPLFHTLLTLFHTRLTPVPTRLTLFHNAWLPTAQLLIVHKNANSFLLPLAVLISCTDWPRSITDHGV